MRSFFSLFITFLSVLLLTFAVSCLSPGDSDNGTGRVGRVGGGGGGNGEGIVGVVALNYDNGRVRCDFTRRAAREYDINCVGVIKTSNGTELKATVVEAGTEAVWLDPSQLSGTQVTLTCQNTQLTQTCRAELPSDDEALLEFSLKLVKSALNLSRNAADQVRLPYNLKTFGNVPQSSFYAARSTEPEPEVAPAPQVDRIEQNRNRTRRSLLGESEDPAPTPSAPPPIPLGVQVPIIPPEMAFLGYPFSSCSIGDKTYFSVGNRVSATFSGGNIVYVADKDGIRLFAGTYSKHPQLPVPDHRIRVYFAKGVHLLCAPDPVNPGVYTVEREGGRILFLSLAGPVKFIAGRVDGKNSSPTDPGPLYCPMGVSVLPDGNLAVANSCLGQITKVKTEGATDAFPTGQLSSLGAAGGATGQRPTAVAVAADGTMYVALGESNGGAGNPQIMKRAPGATSFSVLIPSATLRTVVGTYNDYILTVDAAGTLHFAAYGGKKIYKLTPGLGDGFAPIAGADWSPPNTAICEAPLPELEAASTAKLAFISSLSFRPDGALDVTDRVHCRIRRIGVDGNISTITGMKTAFNNQGLVGKKLLEAVFPRIVSMTMGTDGAIYFTEPYSYKIHKISADGMELSHIDIPNAPDTGLGSQDSWVKHVSLAAAPNGDIYVFTRFAPQLRKLSPTGEWSTVGEINGPMNHNYSVLTVGQDGMPYITLRTDATYNFSAVYRWNFQESGLEQLIQVQNMGAALGLFAMSTTALADGKVFYAGAASPAIFSLENGVATAIAGQVGFMVGGGFSGDGGDALQAKISTPLAMNADRHGNLYFADSENGRVRMLTPKAEGGLTISTLFGGDSAKDCSGNVTVQSGLTGGETAIQQALARLCYFKIEDLSVQNTCGQPDGDIKVAFTQRYTDIGSIVRVVRPCPAAE